MQYIWLLVSAVLVGIDRLTKWLVTQNMELKQSIHIIKIGDTELLNITYCTNSGAAFSQFEGETSLLVCVTTVMITVMVMLLLMKHVKKTPYMMALSLIIGGGVGNLIDRLFNGGLVVDFIDVEIIHFAVFNFADICAVCGVFLLFFAALFDDSDKKKQSASEALSVDEEEDTPLELSEADEGGAGETSENSGEPEEKADEPAEDSVEPEGEGAEGSDKKADGSDE